MSVIVAKRREGKLKVLVIADDIVTYMLKFVSSEKHFPKKSRWVIAGEIASCIKQFYRSVNLAYEIKAVTEEEFKRKHFFLTDAFAHLETSVSELGVAELMYNFSFDDLDYWAGLVLEERKLISGSIRKIEEKLQKG